MIKSYKVFHCGAWHIVEPGRVGDLWTVFVDGEKYHQTRMYDTEDEVVFYLSRIARASMWDAKAIYPNSNRRGYKVWNENKPARKLTAEERFLINPAPEDFLEGGLYIDERRVIN